MAGGTVRFILGTVNYPDYVRVSLAKVSAPSTEVYVEYLNSPLSNYVFVKDGLDFDNYLVTFRDTPDMLSLGTLVSQAFFNIQSGEFEREKYFYRLNNLPGTASISGAVLTDTRLVNANVIGVYKEALRELVPVDEWEFDDAAGTVTLLGANMDFIPSDEVFIIERKYNVPGNTATSAASLFTATIAVTASTYTVSATDKGKRFCLDCSGSKQTVTLPALSALAAGDTLYFEHRRNGVQAQSRIVTAGSDKVLFNGFNLGSNELTELFVNKGKSLYLRKEGSYWEVNFDYDGPLIGERMSGTWRNQPNWLPEDGRLLDGDEYPGLYWWLRSVVDNTHYITDDTVVGTYTHPAGKEGLFVIHSTLKKFRLPNMQSLSERGLKDFDSYGADADRVYDYPGGVQNDTNKVFWSGSIGTLNILKVDGTNTEIGTDNGAGSPNIRTGVTVDQTKFSSEVRVKNAGVIYMRHI